MTIQKRGETFGVMVYDPRKKGRKRWVGTFPTLEAATQAHDREVAIMQSMRRPSMRTVGEWCEEWLTTFERPAPNTNRNYRLSCNRIKADIGTWRLSAIDRSMARHWANEWPEGITRVAYALFADAVRETIIDKNPFKELRRKHSYGRKDLDAPTEADVIELADAALPALGAYGPEFRALLLFLGFVGCRPGELCCIRRADVDFERGEVAIRFALDGIGGEKFPKNNRQRIVSIPPVALMAIMQDVPVRTNKRGRQSPYLFNSFTGKRLSQGTLRYYWLKVKHQWGKRPDIQPYHLRHACATLLLERGCAPHVVAHQLGHTDGGVLVQTLYGHPSDEGMRSLLQGSFAEDVARPTLRPARTLRSVR